MHDLLSLIITIYVIFMGKMDERTFLPVSVSQYSIFDI